MGLTIHYSGRFNPAASLPAMIEEVKDIVSIYKWPYNIYETEFVKNELGKTKYTDKVYGISFTPPECETVSIQFLSNGRMSNEVNLEIYGNSKIRHEKKFLYMLFTKTQFAGMEIHKLVVHLLKHIEKKYLLDFKVNDEGEYWNTLDEKMLAERFTIYNMLLDDFTTALEIFPVGKGERFDKYFMRLMKEVKKKNNNR